MDHKRLANLEQSCEVTPYVSPFYILKFVKIINCLLNCNPNLSEAIGNLRANLLRQVSQGKEFDSYIDKSFIPSRSPIFDTLFSGEHFFPLNFVQITPLEISELMSKVCGHAVEDHLFDFCMSAAAAV
jgi:hypothetical protein